LLRFCGYEEYALSTAEMLAFSEDEGVRLWFDADTEGECLKSLPDTASLRAHPQVSIRVDLNNLVPDKLVGRRFRPTQYDENGDPPGTILYAETDELCKCTVEVLARNGHFFEVRLSGVTTDVCYYDGSKPETRVEVLGVFAFADVDEWEPPAKGASS
jgi:hypothetical protein